ncbi:Sas10 C-terminal domain-containing protein [Phlebopus sp. FC_14]|nr:Sas10 C-terminal domain-containing protein [Phlebopus sp. FC_14]
MPRRRASSKGKPNSKPRAVDRKDSRIKRWDKASDIELDEEDQFHASRDKILLDDVDNYADEGEDEEEVFSLKGISDEEDSEDNSEAEVIDFEDETEEDMERKLPSGQTKSSKTKVRGSKRNSTPPQLEEEESWGRGKSAYYSSNAAQIESDEEANELEEQEALRLQSKARDNFAEDDFGFGEVIEGEVELIDEVTDQTFSQDIDAFEPSKDVPQDKQSILHRLEKESPETLALARDWDDTTRNLLMVKARIATLKESEADAMDCGLQHMYYQALLTYATTLAFYLYMRSSPKYASRPELLRNHPILKRLLTLKQSLSTLESIGVGQDDLEAEDEDEDEDPGYSSDLWSLVQKHGLESNELSDLLADATSSSPPANPDNNDKPTKKKRKTSSSTPPSGPVFDLVEPDGLLHTASAKKKKTPSTGLVGSEEVVDAFGEATSLQHADASDKQARKKSLRFYVSRIESSSARRKDARANAGGGDDDIPYRERRKEREARLEKETQKKAGTLGLGGDDLEDVNMEITRSHAQGTHSRKRQRDDDDDDDDHEGSTMAGDYYDLVKRKSAHAKAQKKAEYELAVAASRLDLDDDEISGPRSITRAIMKNKGLTPRRAKSVRNPRVKKRQKYDQAKKKVSSQKAVYKGGIGDVSKYSGEQSGISKVVKSIRLG